MTRDQLDELLKALQEPAVFVNQTHVGFMNAMCRLTFYEAVTGVPTTASHSRLAVVMPRVDAVKLAELILRTAREAPEGGTIVPFTGMPPQ